MIKINNKGLYANILLLLASAIWGLAFVAQRIGAQYIGAFTFNGIRFAIGGLSLIPLIIYMDNNKNSNSKNNINIKVNTKKIILSGILAGILIYAGSTLQQAGLAYTTAGKASFITGLYMVLVPIIGLFLKQKIGKKAWLGIIFASLGLYLLSITDNFSISYGDLLEVIGSIFWACHILVIDNFSKKMDPLKLSFTQFITCSLLSLISALIFDTITISGISQALIPILYGGLLSVGVAYTIQVIAQKHANPSHAGIILSMESVFGAIGGVIFLGERLNMRGYIGCMLILLGILISQIKFSKKEIIKNINNNI